MVEVWREITELPEYEVSNTGFVRNKKTQRILNAFFNRPGGYLRVDIKGKLYYVHRLVYETFNGCINDNEKIMFWDGDHNNTAMHNLYAREIGYAYADEAWLWD